MSKAFISNRNRIFSIFIILLLSFNVISQEIGFSILRNYSTKDDANLLSGFCCVQDNRGVVYVGASVLFEYDGVSWRTITIDNFGVVYDLAIGNDGKVYVVSLDEFGYLTTDELGRTKFKSLKPLLKDKDFKLGFSSTIQTTKDFIYFSTQNSILQYSPKENKINVCSTEIQPKSNFIFSNTYFVLERNGGMIKFNDKIHKTEFHSDFFKLNNAYSSGANYKDSTVIFTIPKMGVYSYNPNTNQQPQRVEIETDFFNDNYIKGTVFLKDGGYIIGSMNKGAMLFDKKGTELQHYHKSSKLQSNLVYDMNKDKSQNLWLCLDRGVSKTELGADLSYWDRTTGLDGMIMAIIRFKETLYIATSTGAYFIDKNNKIQVIGTEIFHQCWSFLITADGEKLLMGTQTGIFEIDKLRVKQIFKGKNATSLVQSAIHTNRIYSSSDEQFLSLKYENKQFKLEGLWSKFNELVFSMAEDKKGDIWVSSFTNGIVRITPDFENITVPKKIDYFVTKDGLPSLNNLLAFKYKDNIIWGTEKGLYRFNNKTSRFVAFDEFGKTFCDGTRDVYMFNEMPNNEVLICPTYTTDTLNVGILKKAPNAKLFWNYKPFKRIREKIVTYSYVDDRGIIWIATGENLYRYDKSKDNKDYEQAVNCMIRSVVTSNDSLLYGGNTLDSAFNNVTVLSTPLSLEYNSIAFEYATPFFDHEDENLYSYKLKGYDNQWSKWSIETKNKYEKLREGKYTFYVKSKNIYDKESTIASFSFVIKPPYYRTWWAYFIYAALIGLVIYLIVKLNISRLKKQNEDLELIIESRTNEISVQKEELQNQKEELLKQNDELVKLDEFKKGMTSMIVHDLKNPLNQILNVSPNVAPQKQLEVVQQSGRQMLSMVLNILDVHKYEDSEMELKLINNNLFSVVENVIHQVGFLADRKSIVIENNVATSIFILSDLDVTERIFVNLLSNAVKYTPLNGLIVISASKVNAGLVQIEVCDNGDGIPEDKKHLVFKKFSQIDAKNSGNVRSTGLGLTFCKLAVEAHGGEIGFYSNKDAGTTFWFHVKEGTGIYTGIEITEKQKTDEMLIFTENELAILQPILEKLVEFSIYESTDIEEILAQIKEPKTPTIIRWITEVESCMKNLNVDKYNSLKSIIR